MTKYSLIISKIDTMLNGKIIKNKLQEFPLFFQDVVVFSNRLKVDPVSKTSSVSLSTLTLSLRKRKILNVDPGLYAAADKTISENTLFSG
jgi:hypothetical protein